MPDMPECLKIFLESLSSEQSEEVWKYLDSNPIADLDMIEIVALNIES